MKKLWTALPVGIAFAGGLFVGRKSKMASEGLEYRELRDRLAKFEDYFAVTNKWLKNRNQGISVAEYFRKNEFSRIAIYGMGEIGKRLYEELHLEGIEIEFVLDRRAQRLDSNLKICNIEDEIPPVDVIVITPTFDYDAIEQTLREKTNCRIVSIRDVVMN